jgi:hypothetical protein
MQKLNKATVEFRSCNLTRTATNRIITAEFKYIGDGSTYGCRVEILEDVFALNDGYPDIKKGQKVYSKGQHVFVQHNKSLEGYVVINRPI